MPVLDLRTDEEHDCDRILYSSAFRRLAGVTQVVAVRETQLFHTRLTHTMKVAQLARRLAQDLNRDPAHRAALNQIGGINEAAAEAAALAHDLGHPPFGHVGEQTLDRKCLSAGIDGYEGNAQTFRIVTKLAQRSAPDPGLQLHQRTLNGILKYPWHRAAEDPGADASPAKKLHWAKWGAYQTEAREFGGARAGDTTDSPSVEALLMDWCDDISYALHDLEDFWRVGLIPVDRIVVDEDERSAFLLKAGRALGSKPGYSDDLAQRAFKGLKEYLPDKPYQGTLEDRRLLHEKTSYFIADYFSAVTIVAGPERVRIDPRKWHEIMLLKQLTWQYVVNNPALASLQRGQQEIVSRLFDDLCAWLEADGQDGTEHRLPARLRRIYEFVANDSATPPEFASPDKLRARAVADYIAALTEDQAVDLFNRLNGPTTGTSVLEGWLRW